MPSLAAKTARAVPRRPAQRDGPDVPERQLGPRRQTRPFGGLGAGQRSTSSALGPHEWRRLIHSSEQFPVIRRLAKQLDGIGHSRPRVQLLLSRMLQSLGELDHSKLVDSGRSTRSPSARIFANNYVDVDKVTAIGFDYDYTLVTYQEELQHLIYGTAVRQLIDKMHYPPNLLRRGFDSAFAIRGLAVDRRHGLLIKLSHMSEVQPESVHRGRYRCSREEVYRLYGRKLYISPQYRREYIVPLNDQFSYAEGSLIANTIQALIDHGFVLAPRKLARELPSFHRDLASCDSACLQSRGSRGVTC